MRRFSFLLYKCGTIKPSFGRVSSKWCQHSTPDMAGWMIRLSEYYLQPVHDLMKAEIIKAVKKGTPLTPGQAVAAEAVKRIDAIYHQDNMYKGSSAKKRFDNRQRSVKPLVDAYFSWLKTLQGKSNASSKLKEAMNSWKIRFFRWITMMRSAVSSLSAKVSAKQCSNRGVKNVNAIV